jgi:hypothetical protein
MNVGFIIPVYKDFELLKISVPQIQIHYPDSPISIMSDGNDDSEIKKYCSKNKLNYYLFKHSYSNKTPGAFFRNIITVYSDMNTDVIIKADPDSRVRGVIDFSSKLKSTVFGTLFKSTINRKIYDGKSLINLIRPEFIQNGIFGIGSNIFKTFNSTKYFEDDNFLISRIKQYLAHGLPGEYNLSTELLMSIACKDLNIELYDHPDFYAIIYMKRRNRYFYNEFIDHKEAKEKLQKYKFVHPIYE